MEKKFNVQPYKVGDRVKLIGEDWAFHATGAIYRVASTMPESSAYHDACMGLVDLQMVNDYSEEFELVKEEKEEMKESVKRISPEDKVSIETTYGELAKVIALFYHSNGKIYGDCIYTAARHAFKSSGLSFDEVTQALNSIPEDERVRIDYNAYQHDYINQLFKLETEEQKLIRELEKSIAASQQRLAELKKAKENK